MKPTNRDLRNRLAEIRLRHFGPRGKSRFARELGLQPSTYNHYEKDRTPPVDLLVLAARLTRTSLTWLLTGHGPIEAEAAERVDPEAGAIVERLEQLLARRPDLKRSAADFVELMERAAGTSEPAVTPHGASIRVDELVPVVGSTAAGPARFWSEVEGSTVDPPADSRLEQLLQQQSERRVRPAELTAAVPDVPSAESVSLIQLSRPDETGIVEFLGCGAVRSKYPRAVAWRIDGDSMAPRYRDGDFVIGAPDVPAVEGHPCIARQRGQIGVNCKIFHREGNRISLIPVNESSPTQTSDESDLLWAQRVLFSVRVSPRR